MRQPDPLDPKLEAMARALVEARASHRPLDADAHALPATMRDAETVVDKVTALLGETVGGWKVSIAADETVHAAPLYASLVWDSGVQCPRPQTGGVEAELAVVMARDLPPRSGGYSREAVLDAVGGVFAGVEILDSRLGTLSAPTLLQAADNFSNGGFVRGSLCDDWRTIDLAALRCVIAVNGAIVFDKRDCHPRHDPLAPLVAFAQLPASRLGGIKAGQVITTGSLNGLLAVKPGQTIQVTLDGVGSASMAFD